MLALPGLTIFVTSRKWS